MDPVSATTDAIKRFKDTVIKSCKKGQQIVHRLEVLGKQRKTDFFRAGISSPGLKGRIAKKKNTAKTLVIMNYQPVTRPKFLLASIPRL
jgi:hypothetical protein